MPGYGECIAAAKHAKIPHIKNLPYDTARRKVIASGWQPKVILPGAWKNGVATVFWDRGDTEVESCSEGRAYCRFNFTDKFGNWLVVFTAGEEELEHHRAVVTYAGVLCPEK